MNLKKRVVKFYEKNIEKSIKFFVKHFLDEGIPKTTVYRHISCAEAGESGERKKGSGRPPKIATKSNINMLSKLFNKTCGLSQKSAAVTLKCSREYISIMLMKHTSIRCLKTLENRFEHLLS